jgi:pyruvate/2-oxoglutarate dehydrogenase complex dihydrolipoamide acyltransferase (E2) component
MMAKKRKYRVEPIPRMRRFAIDAGYLGRRRHIVHGLIEVDVTDARRLIREHAHKTGEKVSFTSFILYCASKAIEEHPYVHAYRDWLGRLVIYEDINITCMVEVDFGPQKIPIPHVFRGINRLTLAQIQDEMRATQHSPHSTAESSFMRWFLLTPAIFRRLFYWIVMRFPSTFRNFSSPVMITAVGMFGEGGGWAITMPNFTLNIAVGGIVKRPGVHNDEIKIREYLNMTVSIDHDVVDGAPAARFVRSLREFLESAHGLRELKISRKIPPAT